MKGAHNRLARGGGGIAPLGFHLILFENWAGVNANNRKNKTAIKMAGAIV